MSDTRHWIFTQQGDGRIKIPEITAIYIFDHTTVEIITVLVSMPPI